LAGQGIGGVTVAGEGSGAHHQALTVGYRDAGLDPEHVGLASLALAGAIGVWCVHRIQFIVAFGLLGADTLGPLRHGAQLGLHLGDHVAHLGYRVGKVAAQN